MKNEILQRISAVVNALNNITVSGKQNLGNLSGSITVLEEVYGMLDACTVEPESKEE